MTIASNYIVGYAIIIVFEFKGVLMNKKEKVRLYFYPDLLLYSLFYVFMH